MQKKVLKTVVKAVIVGALCCSIGDVVAQGKITLPSQTQKKERKIVGGVVFSTKDKEMLLFNDSVRVGIPIAVHVSWDAKYFDKIGIDSVCFVHKLSAEEQQRTGKTEELIRDKTFVPHEITPKELASCQYTFTVNPGRTVVYFIKSHSKRMNTRGYSHRINIIDKQGKIITCKK